MHSRVVEVGADRLERWVAGFGERHGGFEVEPAPGELLLRGGDGSSAALHVPYPTSPAAPAEPPVDDVAGLVANASATRTVAALLVRRGGYACVVVREGHVIASKVGSRHVQGRTAAGGWSQQRFARRREGQAAELARAATEVAVRVLVPAVSPQTWLVTGGDRALLAEVLAERRLAALADLPAGPYLEVGDPKGQLVKALPERLRAVRITLTDP